MDGVILIDEKQYNIIVGSLIGAPVLEHFTNDTKVSFSYGLNDMVSFDKSDVGTPIVFQLAKTSSHTGECSYTYYTDIRYVTLFTPTGSSLTSSFYTDAETISNSVGMTLA